MKLVRAIATMFGVLLLAGCSGYNSNNAVEALNVAEAVGSPFTQALAREYRIMANYEQNQMFDYPDALHFARKGLAAAGGEVVLPEVLDDWDLDDKYLKDLAASRTRLIALLDIGAREMAPEQAAIAQARFDCWVEQQEEDWQEDEIAACRKDFADAMRVLNKTMGKKVRDVEDEMAEAAAPAKKAEPVPTPIEQAMFLVFFDWNKSMITAGGNDVLDAVSKEVTKRADEITSVVIIGHTDSSGPKGYNQKLSMRRAQAAKDGLVKMGIAAEKIRVEARGENDLLVKTDDNVREPANRRAEIRFE